jgi:hypothetical protein
MNSTHKDGVYRGDYGIVYFVHDGRVIMRHLGSYYKTSTHFLFGKWDKELNEGWLVLLTTLTKALRNGKYLK